MNRPTVERQNAKAKIVVESSPLTEAMEVIVNPFYNAVSTFQKTVFGNTAATTFLKTSSTSSAPAPVSAASSSTSSSTKDGAPLLEAYPISSPSPPGELPPPKPKQVVLSQISIESTADGEAEMLLTPVTASTVSSYFATPDGKQTKRRMTLKILRGRNMPVDNPCVRISQLEEMEGEGDDDDDNNTKTTWIDDISVGETTIDLEFRGMATGNSRDPIWGGVDSTWTIEGNEETTLAFYLYRNLTEKNYHLAQASIKVGDLLRQDHQFPNVWLDFSDDSHVFTKGQIQVRLTIKGTPSLHPQLTCKHITPGPAIEPKSSYVIRKMALYCCAPVTLNVYDVSNNVKIENLNKYIKATMGAGIFHAAIEVYGKEYSFGGTSRERKKKLGKQRLTGIFSSQPRKCPMHHYRESVYLGDCDLSPAHVERILEDMRPEWLASSYNLFHKNCCFFSREFAIQLGVGDIPDWVNSLAENTGFIEPYLNRLGAHLEARTHHEQEQTKAGGTPLSPGATGVHRGNHETHKNNTNTGGATTPKTKTRNKVAAMAKFTIKQPKPMQTKGTNAAEPSIEFVAAEPMPPPSRLPPTNYSNATRSRTITNAAPLFSMNQPTPFQRSQSDLTWDTFVSSSSQEQEQPPQQLRPDTAKKDETVLSPLSPQATITNNTITTTTTQGAEEKVEVSFSSYNIMQATANKPRPTLKRSLSSDVILASSSSRQQQQEQKHINPPARKNKIPSRHPATKITTSPTNSKHGQEDTIEVTLLDHIMAARIQRSFRHFASLRNQRIIRQTASEEC